MYPIPTLSMTASTRTRRTPRPPGHPCPTKTHKHAHQAKTPASHPSGPPSDSPDGPMMPTSWPGEKLRLMSLSTTRPFLVLGSFTVKLRFCSLMCTGMIRFRRLLDTHTWCHATQMGQSIRRCLAFCPHSPPP